MESTVVETQRIIRNGNLETQYDPEDFVNPASFEPHPRKTQKAFVILDGGFVRAIVFAEYYAYSEQDALDEAADSGKLGDPLTESDLEDYETGYRSDEGFPEYEGISYLGNAGEPYADEGFDIWVVDSGIFAEDDALMSSDRVLEHLTSQKDSAEQLYRDTDVESPEWLSVVKARDNARDALTLAWFTINR